MPGLIWGTQQAASNTDGRETCHVAVVLAMQFHLIGFRHVFQNSNRALSGRYKTGGLTRTQWPLVLANGEKKGLVRVALQHESLTHIRRSAPLPENSLFLSTVPRSTL